MYKYQTYRTDEEIRKNLDKIANIIVSEKFDIIALQEIFSKRAMDNILIRLGKNWTGMWDSPNARTAQAAEGYAFIWNKRRINLAESVMSNGRRIYYPRIYNQYKIDRENNQAPLIRNPYYGRFIPVYGFFEIRILNVHIMYSAKSNENKISLSDVIKRKKEFEVIARNIYAKEADKRYGNNMPAYTVIAGDYNLNLNRPWTKWPYVDEVIKIEDKSNVKYVRTVQDQLTTLKKTTDNNETRGFANNYDHFSYDTNRFRGIKLESRRIDTVRKYEEDDFDRHREEISDHIPIMMNINLR